MKRNVGKLDRLIRVTIATFLVLLVLSNYVLGPLAAISVLVALILYGTGIFGFCPIYTMLRISSFKK